MITFFGRSLIAAYITNDEAVKDTVTDMFMLVAVVYLFDGAQGFMQGPILSMGLQKTASYFVIAYYWLIGLPLAYYLSFKQNLGAMGLFAGIGIANVFQCVTYFVILVMKDWQEVADKISERNSRNSNDGSQLEVVNEDYREIMSDGNSYTFSDLGAETDQKQYRTSPQDNAHE